MWVQERHQRILNVLETNMQVSAADLSELLGVSRETIRRDLRDLEDAGHVNRVHGGAILPRQQAEAPFEKRKLEQQRAKSEIARKAVSLVPAGASLFVDAGTTTEKFGHELAKLSGIMVVTNSIDVAMTIKAGGNDIDLLLLGGRIATDVPSTQGDLTLSEIRRFNLDLAFIGPVAIDASKGAFSFDMYEAEISSAMIGQSTDAIFLADHTKLGAINRILLCEANEIGAVVTDRATTEQQIEAFSANNIKLVL